MVRVIGPGSKRTVDTVNTTSTSMNWSKGLSPFFLGPVPLYYKFVSRNVENAWQFSKVYPEHVDVSGNPTQLYWNWANQGWKKYRAERYPMGKGRVPLFSLWEGKKLDYIEARKQIYLPIYRDAVKKTDSFNQLQKTFQEQGSVTLFDFDGYDYIEHGSTLKDVLNNPNKRMGHAFLLAMMLIYGPDFNISAIK